NVKGGNIPQRHLQALFRTGRRDATDGVRRAFGDVGRPVDWIDGDVELRRTRNPCPELFAFENSRRFVLDSLANDDFAADVHKIEHAAHGVTRRRVRCFLVAATKPAQRVECRRLGRPNKIELNDSFDVLIILFWQSQGHGGSIFTHLARGDKRSTSDGFPTVTLKSTAAEAVAPGESVAGQAGPRGYIHPRETCFKNEWDQRS